MKPGGGKRKGSKFERVLCKQLSLWVSGGVDADLFWRSSISGGRATVAQRKGQNIRAAGDICAVSPEGHKLTDRFFIEAKHMRDLQLNWFLLQEGKLWAIWEHAIDQALKHKRSPMVIAKQDLFPPLLLVLASVQVSRQLPLAELGNCNVYRFEEVIKGPFKL